MERRETILNRFSVRTIRFLKFNNSALTIASVPAFSPLPTHVPMASAPRLSDVSPPPTQNSHRHAQIKAPPIRRTSESARRPDKIATNTPRTLLGRKVCQTPFKF